MDVQISITHGKNYMHLGTEHSWYAELLFDSRHVLILSPSWEGTKEITAVGSLLDPDGSKLKFKVLKAAGTEIKNPGRREKLRSEPHILHHCFSCFSWGICQLTAAIGRLRNWRQSGGSEADEADRQGLSRRITHLLGRDRDAVQDLPRNLGP